MESPIESGVNFRLINRFTSMNNNVGLTFEPAKPAEIHADIAPSAVDGVFASSPAFPGQILVKHDTENVKAYLAMNELLDSL